MFRGLFFVTCALAGLTWALPCEAASDRFVGEYTIDCDRQGAQCRYEIAILSRERRTYEVEFVVADRMNINKVHCRVSGEGSVRSDGSLFVVQPGAHALYIRRTKGGALAIEQGRLGICDGIYASGIAWPIGH